MHWSAPTVAQPCFNAYTKSFFSDLIGFECAPYTASALFSWAKPTYCNEVSMHHFSTEFYATIVVDQGSEV
jgi:hypothetical protein